MTYCVPGPALGPGFQQRMGPMEVNTMEKANSKGRGLCGFFRGRSALRGQTLVERRQRATRCGRRASPWGAGVCPPGGVRRPVPEAKGRAATGAELRPGQSEGQPRGLGSSVRPRA